ncbi:hypothetical protein CTI12_AA104090 [Artemisia annua]|uniref:Uncharacterized protein n=1 Tax=Artemisia annua TaxID=35608 RepID=A0A2U1PWE8_ARTAN|nr:hypothetical protein CTI12_AA104090 [Artemisia annua]
MAQLLGLFFVAQDYDDILQTHVASAVANVDSTSILRYNESVPFNSEETPKGNNIGENSFEGGSGSSGKRTIINLDEFDDEEYEARKGKRQMVEVKIEKE